MPPLAGKIFIHSAQLFTISTGSNLGNTSNGKVERQHRVIKERAHACRSTLPFEVLPRMLLVKW